MTNEQEQVLVLRDTTGAYYVIPTDVLESTRVPRERIADVEQAIGGGDTQGFFTLVETPTGNAAGAPGAPGSRGVLIGLLLPAVHLPQTRAFGDGSVRGIKDGTSNT